MLVLVLLVLSCAAAAAAATAATRPKNNAKKRKKTLKKKRAFRFDRSLCVKRLWRAYSEKKIRDKSETFGLRVSINSKKVVFDTYRACRNLQSNDYLAVTCKRMQ